MIYLFNSAYRALYSVNVLKTLGLPTGCVNEYRYRYKGTPKHISSAGYGELKKAATGQRAVVVFIDRFAQGGYQYHPLRWGKILGTKEVNEYFHFSVELRDFVYPRNLDGFNHDIVGTLRSPRLPVLTDNNPKNTNDGDYAVIGGDVLADVNQLKHEDEAWVDAVESLRKTHAFRTDRDQQVVFVRSEIRSGDSVVQPKTRHVGSVYRFNKGEDYALSVSYRYPKQLTDQQAKVSLLIEPDPNLTLAVSNVLIDSHANTVTIPFTTKKHIEDSSATIKFGWADADPPVLGAIQQISARLGDSVKVWMQIIGLLLLFSLLGGFIGTDLPEEMERSLKNYWVVGWPKGVAGVFQALILFWLFRLVGKKIV